MNLLKIKSVSILAIKKKKKVIYPNSLAKNKWEYVCVFFFLHFKNTTALQGGEQLGEKGRGDRRPLGGCVGPQVRDGGGRHEHRGREDEG